MPSWDPAQYLRFGDYRLRPALDLMARIALEAPRVIYDLGCGPGNATRLLRQRWPEAEITGVDGSADMLAKARASDPAVTWQQADLNTWRPEALADLLFSNATLHWLDEHERVFPRLMACLKRGGVLAVQMPDNFAAPTHTLIGEIVRGGNWREQLEPALRPHPVLAPAAYHDILVAHASELDIWQAIYLHVLEGEDPVVEWTKGSVLRPVLDRLQGEEERKAFLRAYGAGIRRAYPRRADGKTLLPFRRLFIVAVR